MGNWVIHVEGHGIHDNGLAEDADAQLLDFVARLKAGGQQVQAASFAVGTVRALPAGADGSLGQELESRP